MAVAHIAGNEFQEKVLSSKNVVFVDFYAPWCGPCKATSPLIDQLSEEFSTVTFYKVNVDENPDLASSYSVFSIPTFVIFKGGVVVSQFAGAMGKEGFISELKKVV